MAGLLDYITEAAKSQYAKGAPYRNALSGLLSGDMSALQELNKPSPVMPNEALDVAMAFAPMGITAFHGSPYKFDKFDASKIGTGAGSVHGKGGYFSSSANYASKFKEPSSGAERTAYDILKQFGNKDDAINHLKDMQSVAYTDLGKQHQQEAINILKSEKITPEGYLYKVDIPDEILPKMINEDLPYNKQPKDIQKLFKDFDPIAVQDKNRVDNYMRRWLRDASTSKQLQDIGYSGVKYQDSANNYVVYDPSIIKILERNGLLFK